MIRMKQKVRELVCEQLSQQFAPCSSYTNCIPRGSPPGPTATQVLAAQTLKIASINGLGDTEKLETELEDEIRWEESRRPPREIIGRFLRRCEEIIHTRGFLTFICIMTIMDCSLVVAELAMDFHHMSNRVIAKKEHNTEFVGKMKNIYSPRLDHFRYDKDQDLTTLYDSFLRSYVIWDASDYSPTRLAWECQSFLANTSFTNTTAALTNSTLALASSSSGYNGTLFDEIAGFLLGEMYTMEPMDLEHTNLVTISHYIHYVSLAILSFLLLETLLKVAAEGKRFFRKKMEVFDAAIIVVSFTLDVVFVEGLTNLKIQHYIIVLYLLLPWRLIRVLNSLVVAIMDQHRIRLKVMYKQKRKVTKQFQESTESIKVLEKQVELLKGLCSSNGIPQWQVNNTIQQAMPYSGPASGLGALRELALHTAESFAPISTSQTQLNTILSSDSVGSTRKKVPIIQCNGEVEHGDLGQGPSSNGHVVKGSPEEIHVEDETLPLSSSLSREIVSRGQEEESVSSESTNGTDVVVEIDENPVVEVNDACVDEGKDTPVVETDTHNDTPVVRANSTHVVQVEMSEVPGKKEAENKEIPGHVSGVGGKEEEKEEEDARTVTEQANGMGANEVEKKEEVGDSQRLKFYLPTNSMESVDGDRENEEENGDSRKFTFSLPNEDGDCRKLEFCLPTESPASVQGEREKEEEEEKSESENLTTLSPSADNPDFVDGEMPVENEYTVVTRL